MRSTGLLFAVLALAVYGQLGARSLAHASESVSIPGKLRYLLRRMFTDIQLLGLALIVASVTVNALAR